MVFFSRKVKGMIVPVRVNDGDFLPVKEYILQTLGDPMISVPINVSQLNRAIEDALEVYYMYASSAMQYMLVDYWIFTTNPGQNLYPLDKCIDPAKIRSVVYNPQNYSLFNISFNRNFDFLFFTTSEQMPDLATFYMAMMKQETVNQVLGQNGTWNVIGAPPLLQLFPEPVGAVNVAVVFSRLPDQDTLSRIGWIRRYALARTKQILGEILSRYTSIPGGQGDITLNGETLKNEGKEETEKLRDEIMFLQDAYYVQTDEDRW